MRSPYLFLIVFLTVLMHRAAAQLPALPNFEMLYFEEHSSVSSPPDIDYEVIHYWAFLINPGDTLLTIFGSVPEAGQLYGTDSQVWYRRTGTGSPAYSDFNFEQGTWYLLYDYSLEPGDTAYFEGGVGAPVIIDSITVSYDYGYASAPLPLKVFHLSNYDVIIEKIGSLRGLFQPYARVFEHGSVLCSGEGAYYAEEAYVSFYGNGCSDVSGIDEQHAGAVIYPNPFSTLLTVKSAGTIDRITVYDAQGRQVLSEHAGQLQKELDVSGLPEAVYTVVVVLEDQTELRKSCVKL